MKIRLKDLTETRSREGKGNKQTEKTSGEADVFSVFITV